MPAKKIVTATATEVAPTPSLNIVELNSQALAQAKANMQSTEPMAFMKADKRGRIVVGRDLDPVSEEELFAFNIQSAKIGASCWNGGQVVDEVMCSIFSGDPFDPNALEDHGPYVGDGDGWKDQLSIEGHRFKTGQHVKFAPTSHGGRQTLQHLTKEMLSAIEEAEDYTLTPICRWKYGSYKHTKYGEILTQSIEIVSIVPADKVEETVASLKSGN